MLIKSIQKLINTSVHKNKQDKENKYQKLLLKHFSINKTRKKNTEIIYFFKYKQIKHLILKLKYQNNKYIQKAFAEILDEYLTDLIYEMQLWDNKPIKITYIPNNITRQIKYGFNPIRAVLLKSKFKNYVHRLFINTTISRQKNLNVKERLENKKHGFYCFKKLNNCRVIIVDDVVTTGSSLIYAKKQLQKCGAKDVILLALSKA